jgi:trigger factor
MAAPLRPRAGTSFFVSTTIQDVGPCKKLVRVEIEAGAVDEAFAATKTEFGRNVSLPGFRPGKAPKHLIERTFTDRIKDEVKRKLLNDSYRQALEEHKLRPIGAPQIEDVQFGPGQAMIYTAAVEVEPQFDLPDYTGLAVRRENRTVTDDDVARALEVLREQRADFKDVDRPLQSGDYAVVNYTGTCDGKPITDTAPTARGLTTQTNFWLHIQTEHFIPGFTDQLLGAGKGDQRTVTVTFPADFVSRELAGKVGVYTVDIVQAKEKQLPALDEALAKAYGAASLEQLRTGVRTDLENELKTKTRRDVRNQIISALLGRISLELPDSLVDAETRGAVYDIVKANADRGVPKEAIDEKKDEIYSVATNSAKERLKVTFLLTRIAEKENLKVTDQEMTRQLLHMAAQQQVKPEKLVKQLRESGELAGLHRQILHAKVLDLLELKAVVEEVPAAQA